MLGGRFCFYHLKSICLKKFIFKLLANQKRSGMLKLVEMCIVEGMGVSCTTRVSISTSHELFLAPPCVNLAHTTCRHSSDYTRFSLTLDKCAEQASTHNVDDTSGPAENTVLRPVLDL